VLSSVQKLMNAMLRNLTVLFTSLATKPACLIASRKRTVLTSKLEVPAYRNAVVYCQRRFKETDYSKFGNEPDKPTKFGIFYRLFLAAAPWIIFFSPMYVLNSLLRAKMLFYLNFLNCNIFDINVSCVFVFTVVIGCWELKAR
jgi:hypothetical protein